ncbi:hypothetical protein C3486_36315 [Streptomyces sp. Ru73]|nr:hypothetical protein C3486_36315 [Streptomyces sp. Ru73]
MAVDDVDGTLAGMGPRLRAARERHGATLAGVSCATGISASTLSRMETGRRKPTLEVLLQLSKEYGISLDELAGTAPAPAAKPRAAAQGERQRLRTPPAAARGTGDRQAAE